MAMVKHYQRILLVHSHDAREVSRAVLEIERAAFLDGHYFAFALRFCHLCKMCQACPTTGKVRPCDQSFGIDVYKTVRALRFPAKSYKRKTTFPTVMGSS